jgi:plastocyanin
MKRFLLLSLSVTLISSRLLATVHVVRVADFQFTPASLTDVFVGDVIHFVWISGSHTTTNDPASQGTGNELPAGAAPWNSPLNSSTPSFDYSVRAPGTYKYWCIPHHLFGMVGQFSAAIVAPVKISSFLLSAAPGKITLNWTTASEENASYFSIRRSFDGINFSEIAKVNATGTSQAPNTYSYSDAKISSTRKYYYYHIATIDKDGKETFSETKLCKNSEVVTKLILSISPNPVTGAGHLMMTFNADKPGTMDVKIVDPSGRIVLRSLLQAYTGVNSGHVHLANLRRGMYTLVCTLNEMKESQKMIIQ